MPTFFEKNKLMFVNILPLFCHTIPEKDPTSATNLTLSEEETLKKITTTNFVQNSLKVRNECPHFLRIRKSQLIFDLNPRRANFQPAFSSMGAFRHFFSNYHQRLPYRERESNSCTRGASKHWTGSHRRRGATDTGWDASRGGL